MKTILVTGANGFIGQNLCVSLSNHEDIELLAFGRENSEDDLRTYIDRAQFIFHLAGVNRPKDEKEFETDNLELTEKILSLLSEKEELTPLLITSSTQAALDNPYGKSKKAAEDAIVKWSKNKKNPAYIYRLPNVFGKWAKPNYNSVVATFCYNLVHDLPLQINEPERVLDLIHIDDVVNDFIARMEQPRYETGEMFCDVSPVHQLTVGRLAETLAEFWDSRQTQLLPDLSSRFNRALYGTLTSYYEMNDLSVKPTLFSDERGWLFELVKSSRDGQVFVSSTKPGFTRGDHWHHTKVEKFTLIKGRGKLLFRHVASDEIITYELSEETIQIVDIPVGYVHAIQNDGEEDMLVLFWASEILDKEHPDTYYVKVRG